MPESATFLLATMVSTQQSGQFYTFDSGPIVEYSRPQVPSSSRGCEIEHISFRHMLSIPLGACIDHAVINLVRCQHWHASCVGFVSLSIPNEDLGRIDKRGNPDFEGSTFQGREYSIWATNH
jgi:hypothetical protein